MCQDGEIFRHCALSSILKLENAVDKKPDSFLPVLFLSTTCLNFERIIFFVDFFCSRLASFLHSLNSLRATKKWESNKKAIKNQVEECSRQFRILKEQTCPKKRRGAPWRGKSTTIKCWASPPWPMSNGLLRWVKKNGHSTWRTSQTS